MPTDVIMPALGMAQEKGILLKWLKSEGEAVSKGEPLMEVETDKATVEIEAPASGVLAQVSAAEGDEVPVGQAMAVILAAGESLGQSAKAKPKAPPAPVQRESGSARPESVAAATSPRRTLASPAAKRIAKEKGIDLEALKGSGPEGAILAEDVLRASEAQAPAAGVAARASLTVPLTAMRRVIAERMAKSKQTAPHFYVSMDVDMTEVTNRRAEWKEKGRGVIPSINDFILRACARALKDFPSLNSRLTDEGVELLSEINIGMAVALDEGLVAPVIRNADRLSLEELAQKSRELVEKAQKKKLFPLDYEEGTFTVSNLGMLGAESFIAIINPPQCAILAVGQVARKVVAHGDSIAIRPNMTMTLSADHRIVDGAIAARFLKEVKESLETLRDLQR